MFEKPHAILPFRQHATRRTEFDNFEYDFTSTQRFINWVFGQRCIDPATDMPSPRIDWLAYLVTKKQTNLISKYISRFVFRSALTLASAATE